MKLKRIFPPNLLLFGIFSTWQSSVMYGFHGSCSNLVLLVLSKPAVEEQLCETTRAFFLSVCLTKLMCWFGDFGEMCAYLHVCVHTYVCVCTHMCMCTLCLCVLQCMCVCVCASMHTCVCARTLQYKSHSKNQWPTTKMSTTDAWYSYLQYKLVHSLLSI